VGARQCGSFTNRSGGEEGSRSAPTTRRWGTKDFASYIAKIGKSKADGVYLALPGQDATIYSSKAHQFGVNAR